MPMKKQTAILIYLSLILFIFGATATLAQQPTELKLDPLMFVSLKECRNISKQIGPALFPGWQFEKTPVLFYRPNVQEILINYPHQPKGFKEFTGLTPLGKEKLYYRNDTTFFDIDGQNTAFNIDGIRVLVVADRSSNLRNQLVDVALNRPKEDAQKYFDTWGFMPSAYDDIFTILHESFHVYQRANAPKKFANEATVVNYPVLDPVNNALYMLEGKALRDALLAKTASESLEKAKQFVAVRSYRQSLLDSTSVEYENLNEYAEGLAKYIEFAFAKKGTALIPGAEMRYFQGFNGYGTALSKALEEKINKMVEFVSVSNNAFSNKFGTGPLRFKLYSLGACEGLLLDQLMPTWKSQIFKDKKYLAELLKESVHLSPQQLQQYLQAAKTAYNYEQAYADKLQFEKDGQAFAQSKADKILKTDKTLVRISFGGFVDKAFLSRFTPFGVTKVNPSQNIYDLVPVLIGFKAGVSLDLKQPIPVLVDKEQKQVLFVANISPAEIKTSGENRIENSDFVLFGTTLEISVSGNIVDIKLK